MHANASTALFLVQVIVLLVAARAMGELLQRLHQPAVMGQLLGGMLLGPAVLGGLEPGVARALFPDVPAQHAMLDGLAELGVLLLLLLTGMETDLALMRRSGRAAIAVSLCGMLVPFGSGALLGRFLPDELLATPGRRLVTALFLGTAMAISSVKIVALVVREMQFARRTVGQVILAAALIDDAIGWTLVALIFGLARQGGGNGPDVLHGAVRSVLGTVAFLGLSLTLGRRLVAWLIRAANDHLVSELPVITLILVIAGAMALLTHAIGVHTVLGAFVAGVLVGESPILTRHIEQQLRGLIVALFTPVFFGSAGLSVHLDALLHPQLAGITGMLIVIASVGKFGGALLGGQLGRLSLRQSLAVGCGMNARGSTEVIIASVALAAGLIVPALYTAIVAMAVVTTLAMPAALRLALRRLPLTPEEDARLAREALEARGFVPRIERLLLAVDASPSGQFAARLAGLVAGARQVPTTALHFDYAGHLQLPDAAAEAARTGATLRAGASTGSGATKEAARAVDITLRVQEPRPAQQAIVREARKGYSLLLIGREPASEGGSFHQQIVQTARDFAGPFAVAIARGTQRGPDGAGALRILAPVSGAESARDGAELGIVLASASGGTLTALHVPGRGARRSLGGRWRLPPDVSVADAILREVRASGRAYGVDVRGMVRAGDAAQAIIAEARRGDYALVVLGVRPRPGEQLFFGEITARLLERLPCSLLLLSTEALPGAAAAQAR